MYQASRRHPPGITIAIGFGFAFDPINVCRFLVCVCVVCERLIQRIFVEEGLSRSALILRFLCVSLRSCWRFAAVLFLYVS